MARVAFDIDEKAKREIRIRLAEQGRTLSEVMRTFCSYYKDFGLYPGRQIKWEDRDILPDIPAVYFVYTKKKIQYIGQTKSLHTRFTNHHRNHQFAKLGASIFWIETSADRLAELEGWFIDVLEPSLNRGRIPSDGKVKNRTNTSITLDEKTLKELDDMARKTRRSRSRMIEFLVDLFKFMIREEAEFDEDDDEITEGD